MHARTHVWMHLCIHVCMHACMHAWNICIRPSIHLCMHVCLYDVCVYRSQVCACICVSSTVMRKSHKPQPRGYGFSWKDERASRTEGHFGDSADAERAIANEPNLMRPNLMRPNLMRPNLMRPNPTIQWNFSCPDRKFFGQAHPIRVGSVRKIPDRTEKFLQFWTGSSGILKDEPRISVSLKARPKNSP